MKETDLNLLHDSIALEISENDCEIVDLIGQEQAILCVMNIYLSSDLTTAYGQNFIIPDSTADDLKDRRVSVISSPYRISIITPDGMSFYKSDGRICDYSDLGEDIYYILVIIQAVLDRISSNNA